MAIATTDKSLSILARLESVEERVAAINHAVAELESRLLNLENGTGISPPPATVPQPSGSY